MTKVLNYKMFFKTIGVKIYLESVKMPGYRVSAHFSISYRMDYCFICQQFWKQKSSNVLFV